MRLRTGDHVIGRGMSSDIVLDDSQVSRQHARLEVTTTSVVIVDLDSVNGSVLNGRRLRGRKELQAGDRLKLGNSLLELCIDDEAQEDRSRDTVEGIKLAEVLGVGEEDIPTRRTDGLEVAGTGAEIAYAEGRPDKAERFLSGYLASVLSELEAGRSLPEPTVLEAVKLSMRLAAKTLKGAWVDFVVKLLLAHRSLPPAEQLGELSDLAQRLVIDRELLLRYEAEMRRIAPSLDASGRAALGSLTALCAELARPGYPPSS